MKIIKHKSVFLSISVLLVIASIAAIVFFGFKLGTDFSGGVAWQIRFETAPAVEKLAPLLPSDAVITPQSEGNILIRMKELSEVDRKADLAKFVKAFGPAEELQFQSIGPVVGQDLKQKAVWAFVLVLVAISLYVAFTFRKVSRPVSSWKYGFITLATLFHDAVIPAGMIAVLGHFFTAEVDTNFIVAILVVIGFSVHDKIVVFDRIRENLRMNRVDKADFSALVNTSVNQTIARSINTSFTLILTLVAMLALGPATLHYFILTILVGTVVGTYSSIFVASPLLTFFKGKA